MPIFDQFETEPYVTYSGSYTDNIVHSRPITKQYLDTGAQSLGLVIGSNRIGGYDNINFLSLPLNDRLNYISGAWAKGQQKNIAVPHFSTEYIFDSFPPSPASIITRDGYDFPSLNFTLSASQQGIYFSGGPSPSSFGRFNITSSLYTYSNQISGAFNLKRPPQTQNSVNIIYPGVLTGQFSDYGENIYGPVSKSLDTKRFADLTWLSGPYPYRSLYKNINKLYNLNSRYSEPVNITKNIQGDDILNIFNTSEIGSLHVALGIQYQGSTTQTMNRHRFFSDWSQIWFKGEHRFLKSYNSLYGSHYFLTGTADSKQYKRCVATFGERGTILVSTDPQCLTWNKIASQRPFGYPTDLPLTSSGYIFGSIPPSPIASSLRLLGGIQNWDDPDPGDPHPYRWLLVQDTFSPGIVRGTMTDGNLSKDQWAEPSSVGAKFSSDLITDIEYSTNYCFAIASPNTLDGHLNNLNSATISKTFKVADADWTNVDKLATWKTVAVGRGEATPGTGGGTRGAILVSDGYGDVWYASQAPNAYLDNYTWVDIVAGPPLSGSEFFPSDDTRGAVRFIVVGFSGSNETTTPAGNLDRKSKVLISSGPPYLGYYRNVGAPNDVCDTWFDITDSSVIPDGVGLYGCDYDPSTGDFLVVGENGFVARGYVSSGPSSLDGQTVTLNSQTFGPPGAGTNFEISYDLPTSAPKNPDGSTYIGRFVSVKIQKAVIGQAIAYATGEDGQTFGSYYPWSSWSRANIDHPAISFNNIAQWPRLENIQNIWGGLTNSISPFSDPLRRFNRGIGPTELIYVPNNPLTNLPVLMGLLPVADPALDMKYNIDSCITIVGESIADAMDMWPAGPITRTNLFLKVSDSEFNWFTNEYRSGATNEPLRYFMSGANLIKPKNEDIYKVFFGFGDGVDLDLTDTIRGVTYKQIGKRNRLVGFKNFSYYDLYSNRPNGSYEFGQIRVNSPILRGWRYGIYNGIQTNFKAIYRRGKYGQFRDMLEQRLFTKYIQLEQPEPYSYPKKGLKRTIDGPVKVNFVSGSAIYADTVDYISATNPSYNPYDSGIYDREYRSGQPFFDRPNED